MHWVIQDNMFCERGYDNFITALERRNIEYTLVKVIPFSHELIPDINPKNPVIAMGAYTMCEIARVKKWCPGVFLNENFMFNKLLDNYGEYLLNSDGQVSLFQDVNKDMTFSDCFFIRPCSDEKSFAGLVMDWERFKKWRDDVIKLEDCYTLTPNTLVYVASVKQIYREYRFYVVNGKIITGSLYKTGTWVHSEECEEQEIIDFAQQMVNMWCPDVAFVIDIAMTPDALKVIEINCMNSAGFYACDMAKVVEAIEDLKIGD